MRLRSIASTSRTRRLRRPQPAFEVAVLDRQDRRRGRRAHELRILGEGLVDDHRRDGLALAAHFDQRAATAGWGRCQRRPVGLAVAARRRVPERDAGARVVEGGGHRVTPLVRRGVAQQLLEQLLPGHAGELLGLEQREHEAQRQHHPGQHQRPGQGLERGGIDLQDRPREVEHQEDGEEHQRRGGDGEERPALRS